MKWIFMFFASISTQAYEGFHCVPSMRDTRLQVLIEDNELKVLIVNPSGYSFMPQFDGPQSIFNISFNQMQAEDLKNLSDSFTFSWPKESCQLDSKNFTVKCDAIAKAPVSDIKSYGLTTTEVIEKYEGTSYEKRKFRLSLEKNNLYFVTIQFDIKSCERFDEPAQDSKNLRRF